jgi:hypothetical protein
VGFVEVTAAAVEARAWRWTGILHNGASLVVVAETELKKGKEHNVRFHFTFDEIKVLSLNLARRRNTCQVLGAKIIKAFFGFENHKHNLFNK